MENGQIEFLELSSLLKLDFSSTLYSDNAHFLTWRQKPYLPPSKNLVQYHPAIVFIYYNTFPFQIQITLQFQTTLNSIALTSKNEGVRKSLC